MLGACSSGTVNGYTGVPAPTSPAAGGVVLSSSTLTFTAAGAGAAQTITASQSSYGGAFTPTTTTCGGIATISPASGVAFTVTSVAAGSCTLVPRRSYRDVGAH